MKLTVEADSDFGLPDYNKELGHLNFTGFEKIVWKAVTQLREEKGMTLESMAAKGKALFVTEINSHFRQELVEGDEIEVNAEIIEEKPRFLKIKAEIFKDDKVAYGVEFKMLKVSIEES